MDQRLRDAYARLIVDDHEAGLALLEAIVRDDLADESVLETLGNVREHLGDVLGATHAYAGAAVHLHAGGEPQRALELLEHIVTLDPEQSWARADIAALHVELGDLPAAWREIELTCEAWIDFNDIAETMDLCRKYEDLLPSDLTAPLSVLDTMASRKSPQTAAVLATSFGHALKRKERVIAALDLFARALAFDPSNREAHHARVGGLLALGQLDDAHAAAQRALQRDDSDLVALMLLERVCTARGDQDGAARARHRVVAMTSMIEDARTGMPFLGDQDDGDDSRESLRSDTQEDDVHSDTDE